VRIMDPEAQGDSRYVAPMLRARHPQVLEVRRRFRNVVEGAQLLGTAIAAARQELPNQRVTMATTNFLRAATFDEPIEPDMEVLRRGKTRSTSEVRITQGGALCSAGILLHDLGAEDVMGCGTDARR
jgi:acyl-CoA thioesterase-2